MNRKRTRDRSLPALFHSAELQQELVKMDATLLRIAFWREDELPHAQYWKKLRREAPGLRLGASFML